MNKKVFEKNICAPLAELTENNCHSEGVVYVATYLDSIANGLYAPETDNGRMIADLKKWAEYVRDEHNRIGHLAMPLAEFRHSILRRCLRELHSRIPNDHYEALMKCL